MLNVFYSVEAFPCISCFHCSDACPRSVRSADAFNNILTDIVLPSIVAKKKLKKKTEEKKKSKKRVKKAFRAVSNSIAMTRLLEEKQAKRPSSPTFSYDSGSASLIGIIIFSQVISITFLITAISILIMDILSLYFLSFICKDHLQCSLFHCNHHQYYC